MRADYLLGMLSQLATEEEAKEEAKEEAHRLSIQGTRMGRRCCSGDESGAEGMHDIRNGSHVC
jgi:hypothetical protein